MVSHLTMPKEIDTGVGSIGNLSAFIQEKQAKRILLVTDKGIQATGLVKLVLDVIDLSESELQVLDTINPEPSYIEVDDNRRIAETFSPDLIVGFGGGSVLDTAKLFSLLIGSDYTTKDLLEDPSIGRKHIPTVMIPTTCGTGSEATINAIVAVPEKETKIGIVNKHMIADYVILDAQVIERLPKHIIAATGVDALAHGVECLTSNKATPLSNLYALEGSRLIIENIQAAYEQADNMAAKEALMLGAFYGGVAITGSGTTAVHALSYPLGGKYHIPHGVSNAILFETVMRFNKDAIQQELASLAESVRPDLTEASLDEKADAIIEKIADIVRVTDIPTNLSGYGVGIDDLDFLIEAGSQQTRLLNNNKKVLSKEDIKNIYLKVLS